MLEVVALLAEELKAGVALLPKVDSSALLRLFEGQCRDRRFPLCRPEEDGDMVLFEWGASKEQDLKGAFKASNDVFDVSLVRQFIAPDEDEPFQVHLTIRYDPLQEALMVAPRGHVWLDRENATQEIQRLEAWRHVESKPIRRVIVSAHKC